uniref:Uncharacterized protein n=1 Tax=Globodera rostochiensis TaxID=31243 RepID=A0A914H2F5_GLORO
MVRKRLPPELIYEITRCVRAHDGWFGVYASTRMLQNFLSLRLEKWAEIGLINIFSRLRAKEEAALQSGSGINLTHKEIRDVFMIEKDVNDLRSFFTIFKATTPGIVMTKFVGSDPSVSLFYDTIHTFLQKYSTSRNAPPPLPTTPIPLNVPRLSLPARGPNADQTHGIERPVSRWLQANRLPASIQMYGEPNIAPVSPVRRTPQSDVGSAVSHHSVTKNRPQFTTKVGRPSTSAPKPPLNRPSASTAKVRDDSLHTSVNVVPHGRPSASTAQIRDEPCAGITLHTSTHGPHARPSAGEKKSDFAETMQSIVGLPFQTKLSSAGLIYAHYGKAVIGSILGLPAEDADVGKLYEQIYKKFVEAIDAIDNGVNQFDGLPRYQLSSTFGSRVEHCNPAWNEEAPDPEKGFQKAMAIVEEEFEQRVRSLHTAWLPARNIVLAAVENRNEAKRGRQYTP